VLLIYPIILAIASVSYFIQARRNYNVTVLINLAIVAVISAITCTEMLSDIEVYEELYNYLGDDGQFTDARVFAEPGYVGLNFLSHSLSLDFITFRWFLVFSALALKVYACRVLGVSFPVASIIYFFLLFEADSYLLRSTLAGGILAVALSWHAVRAPAWKVVSLVFLASFIHISSLSVIPLLFLARIRASEKIIFLCIASLCIFALFPIGRVIVSLLTLIDSSGALIIEKVVDYADSEYGVEIGVFRGSLFLYSLIFLFYVKTIRLMRERYQEQTVMAVYWVVFYSLFFIIAFSDFWVLADRIFRLYSWFLPVAGAFVLSKISVKDKLLSITILIVLTNSTLILRTLS